jgi:nucleotide-binding universal stress UspA family protein
VTRQIKKVLVAHDFSPVAQNAVETSRAICARHGASLSIIHVVENSFAFLRPRPGMNRMILPELVQYANENLAQLTDHIAADDNLNVEWFVRTGNPADQIYLHALDHNVDLIVMGAHGTSGIHDLLIGSNAHRLIKNSLCPVVMVPGTRPWVNFKKILFPVRAHVRPAKKYELLKPIIEANQSHLVVAGVARKKLQAAVAEVQSQVKAISNRMTLDEVDHRTDVHTCDNVARQVLSISESESPDLIAITSSPNRFLRKHFLSAFARDIINRSKIPVLSVRDFEEIPLETSEQSIYALAPLG